MIGLWGQFGFVSLFSGRGAVCVDMFVCCSVGLCVPFMNKLQTGLLPDNFKSGGQ